MSGQADMFAPPSQQSPHPADGFRLAVKMLAMYRAAAWLYHHGPPNAQSPLSDAQFDEFEAALGMPKTLGHTLQLDEAEQARAIAWAAAGEVDAAAAGAHRRNASARRQHDPRSAHEGEQV